MSAIEFISVKFVALHGV